jgi:aspartyl-tRNA(Asn)/glutamyl-tRNA(Gln) amidotransferase subunit A
VAHETLLDQARSVAARERSAEEAVAAALARIDRLEPALNAWCHLDPDGALAAARALDRRIRSGDDVGPLAGVPMGVKDLEDAAGVPTVMGDPARAANPPASTDSVHVARYRAAGAIVLGKTNVPAYGFHAETDNLVSGATRNPWAPSRTAGGSSGGTAAAIAAGMVALGTGSDGGGSIRIPAQVCNLSGFKPTHGVVPSGDDAAPTWATFSTRGPMARTFEEIAYALDVVKGFSARDLLSFDLAGSFVDAVAAATVEGCRVAWAPSPGLAQPAPAVADVCRAAVERLAAHGAVVEEVGEILTAEMARAWVTIGAAGSARCIGDPETWAERFLPAATALAGFGRHVDAAALLDAQAAEHAAGLALAALFERYDVLALPGLVGPPPRLGEESPYGPGWAGSMTLPFNLTRVPAAVVPAGFVVDDGDRLPVGLQLVAPRCADLRLMRAAAAAEHILGFGHFRAP